MPPRPFWPRLLLATLFTVSGFNQLIQVPGEFRGEDALPMLGMLHVVAGVPGILTAIGAWRMTRWAWIAALAWAAATSTLILSLESLLELSAEDAQGFVPAVIGIACVGTIVAWSLYRSARRATGNASSTAVD